MPENKYQYYWHRLDGLVALLQTWEAFPNLDPVYVEGLRERIAVLRRKILA